MIRMLALSVTALLAAPAAAMELTSPDIAPGAPLAQAQLYSECGGGDVSPALSWTSAPAAAKSFAVTLYDPDASGGWWHWIAFDIPAGVHALARGTTPNGARLGENDFGSAAYGGACPPPGSGVHHYRFTLWALDIANLPVADTPKGAVIEPILKAHALGSASLTGTYERGAR